nr:glycosyltransferase family 2 protein [Nitrospirota bacterium]
MERSTAEKPELSVVLPIYNAETFISEVLKALAGYLDGTGLSYEILAVNDGSTDGTEQCIRSCAGDHLRSITLPVNMGKGAAIKRGIAAANGRYIIMTDADVPYGFDSLLHCYKFLQDGHAFAIGDRSLPESRQELPKSPTRRLLTMLYTAVVCMILRGGRLRDTQCGLKGFSSSFAKELLNYSVINRFAFDLEAIIFALENDVAIARFPVVLVRNETSSVKVVKDSLNVLNDFRKLIRKKSRQHYRISR